MGRGGARSRGRKHQRPPSPLCSPSLSGGTLAGPSSAQNYRDFRGSRDQVGRGQRVGGKGWIHIPGAFHLHITTLWLRNPVSVYLCTGAPPSKQSPAQKETKTADIVFAKGTSVERSRQLRAGAAGPGRRRARAAPRLGSRQIPELLPRGQEPGWP